MADHSLPGHGADPAAAAPQCRENLSNAQPVALFNNDAERFDRLESAPRFRDVVVVADAGSVGVSWELDWTRGNADDLEDRLLYCQIERQLIDRPLGEKARRASGSRTFRVKVGDALAPAPGRAPGSRAARPRSVALQVYRPFRRGDAGGRPFRARVRPEYLSTAQSGWPRVLEPIDGVVRLKWTEPERPEGYLAAPAEHYYLVFRREPTLPLGRYPADAAAGASGARLYPRAMRGGCTGTLRCG